MAGATTPPVLSQNPTAPSSPNRCGRLGAICHTPSGSPAFDYERFAYRVLQIATVALWVAVGIMLLWIKFWVI